MATNQTPSKTTPPALIRKRWKPGENTPGVLAAPNCLEVIRLARAASPDAMRALSARLKSDDDRVAIAAAREILDRAWGKAIEMPPPNSFDESQFDAARIRWRNVLIALLEARAHYELPLGLREALDAFSKGDDKPP